MTVRGQCRWRAAMLILCLLGCGKKGPPLIPVRRDLEILEYFRALPVRGGVMLEWKEAALLPPPPEGAWERYRLYREEEGGAFGEIVSRKVGGKGGAVHRHLDLAPPPGSRPRYRLKLLASGGRAAYTAPTASPETGSVPPPVGAPAVEPLDGRLRIAWQPPADGPGSGITRAYNVFRREASGSYRLERPVNADPLSGAEAVDGGLANGRTYCYAVTVLQERGGILLGESTPSPETCAAPRDMTPPAAPTGLNGAKVGDLVSLSWAENVERDVAGYHVYRQAPGHPAVRVTAEPVRGTVFSDRADFSGGYVRYWVTAVDDAKPLNESAPCAAVEVILPASTEELPPR